MTFIQCIFYQRRY